MFLTAPSQNNLLKKQYALKMQKFNKQTQEKGILEILFKDRNFKDEFSQVNYSK